MELVSDIEQMRLRSPIVEDQPADRPEAVVRIEQAASEAGFDAACDARVGALLRTLARSAGDGRFLELGTGPGTSAAWIVDGMTAGATLTTVELDPDTAQIARSVLGDDSRVDFRIGDGSSLLREFAGVSFDLIFADTWPGKYWDLDLALGLLAPRGVYVVDDLLPQPNWPDEHAGKVTKLLETLDHHPELIVTRMAWSTGVVVASRR